MKWYKRLFWKIFAAIWLVSTLSLLAAVILIGAISEKQSFREILSVRAMAYAERKIVAYERTGRQQLPHYPSWKHRKYHDDDDESHEANEDDHHRERHFDRHRRPRIVHRVRIIDLETNTPVISPPRFNTGSDDLVRIKINSETGHSYLVEVDLDWEHSPFGHLLGILFSIQALLIVAGSSLSALLISALIVRPLKRLRAHTSAIAQGELDSRTDISLSQRGDELGELAREFNRMADYVERTLNSHQKLMQDVSHELRAPLARLQAAAGLAEQRLGEEDPAVVRINLECQRLDQLIGELLNLSKLEQQEPSSEPVALVALVNESIQDQQFANPHRVFKATLPAQKQVHINPRLLQRALNNILVNACKHTAESCPIDVDLAATADGFILTIRDHGTGVAEADLEHLFEPFYRANTHSEGYGLGLSIAKRAIDRMGGSLTVNNHPDGGLQVIIRYQNVC